MMRHLRTSLTFNIGTLINILIFVSSTGIYMESSQRSIMSSSRKLINRLWLPAKLVIVVSIHVHILNVHIYFCTLQRYDACLTNVRVRLWCVCVLCFSTYTIIGVKKSTVGFVLVERKWYNSDFWNKNIRAFKLHNRRLLLLL